MPRYDLSFAVHQEFGEIPFDPAAEQAGLFFLQMLEDWVRRVAVDVDLRHQRKADIIGQRTEIRDLVGIARFLRSEEHTSELQSLMRISYAVFCLQKKTTP